MEMKTEQSKSSKRTNAFVKLLVFLVAVLIIGNIVLWIASDYGKHPYLFFLKDLIAWITGINPLLILLLLWISRRHSLACRLGQNSPEEVKEAASEKARISRMELLTMFAGLSLLFFVIFSGPMTLLDLPYLGNPPKTRISAPHLEVYEGIPFEGLTSSQTKLEGKDAERQTIRLIISEYAEGCSVKRKRGHSCESVLYAAQKVPPVF
ncbi:hypothetical protein [Porcincola intestinalis]|uniref:Uncharacterized protein n=1 Tax=Porcincola intestinalis TaxID=2606632 RepID=A0A6L5X2C7_9FIRM|nr:hypothetical protein [Porcincola intestinalis]MSS14370.1 hypothetical protein [Porcincola intestinalis]